MIILISCPQSLKSGSIQLYFLLTMGCFVLAFYVYHNFIYMPDNVYKRTLDTRLSNVYAQN